MAPPRFASALMQRNELTVAISGWSAAFGMESPEVLRPGQIPFIRRHEEPLGPAFTIYRIRPEVVIIPVPAPMSLLEGQSERRYTWKGFTLIIAATDPHIRGGLLFEPTVNVFEQLTRHPLGSWPVSQFRQHPKFSGEPRVLQRHYSFPAPVPVSGPCSLRLHIPSREDAEREFILVGLNATFGFADSFSALRRVSARIDG